MKWYIASVLGLVVVIAAAYYIWGIRGPAYTTITVQRSAIIQEVSATGIVATPSTIRLQFQENGKLAALNVEAGSVVLAGKILARLDTSVLSAQLKQAQAALSAQKAQLLTLNEGTRSEQLAVTQSQIDADKVVLVQAKQRIVDAVKNAYTISDDAVAHSVDHLFNNQNSSNPKISFLLSDSPLQNNLERERLLVGPMLVAWAKDISSISISSGLDVLAVEARDNLSAIATLLADASSALNKATPNQQAGQGQLNEWMSEVVASRNSVDATSATLTVAVTAANNAVAALDRDQKSLVLENAGSTSSIVAAQQAQVDAAQANVDALRAQISEALLVAPVDGTVTNTEGSVGETISPSTVVVTMLPNSKLQITSNVSEGNIAKVKVGEPVRITLDAFGSDTIWTGKVVKIDPAQTEISGAVYYKTTIIFTSPDERLKPGMTANVRIETGASLSTLVVPASAVQANGTSTIVELFKNGKTTKQSVIVGLKSKDGMVEIISGLSEGDQIITGGQQ